VQRTWAADAVREGIHEMLERDGTTVGRVVGLARVSGLGGGQQRRSGIELMEVILPRFGWTGPIRPAEPKRLAIGKQIGTLRTVQIP
jgi:hypothetical protein